MKINPWALDAESEYLIENDADVKLLMLQLGVPDLFADAAKAGAPNHLLVAFDNHPTHWILLSSYQGVPEYSPNHGINKLVGNASPNGLLFSAFSKKGMRKDKFLRKLSELADGDKAPPLSQLPAVP